MTATGWQRSKDFQELCLRFDASARVDINKVVREQAAHAVDIAAGHRAETCGVRRRNLRLNTRGLLRRRVIVCRRRGCDGENSDNEREHGETSQGHHLPGANVRRPKGSEGFV